MSEENTAPAHDQTVAATSTSSAGEVGVSQESERGLRKSRVGVVISDKMTKTIVVDVVQRVPHPRFGKIVKRTTKIYAHDENGEAKTGDKVKVIETRPTSKLKRWRLVEVLAH